MSIKKKRIVFVILVVTLSIIELSSVYLMFKSLGSKDNELYDVVLKSDNKKLGSMFAIMLEQTDGTYDVSEENVWPNNLIYTYNENKSGCVDFEDNKIEGALTFDSATNTATLKTNASTKCYLYFDLEKTVPESFTFYIGGDSNPEYINTLNTSLYLAWSDTDIESYCVTEEDVSDNCTWEATETTTDTSITIDYTLTDDGTKTLNAYLKDLAGNISELVSDSVILDTVLPTVVDAAKDESDKITFNASDEGSGVLEYCINTSEADTTDCSWTEAVEGTNTSSDTVSASGTYYVHLKDKAGNISHSSVIIISEDTLGYTIYEKNTSGLNRTMEGGLYRYQGTNEGVNNYICFGTSDKDTCLSNTDAYMYRIIGINGEGELKLIKKEALNETMKWWTDYATDITWSESLIYQNINGDKFLSNTTYVPDGWSDKITDYNWKYGDNYHLAYYDTTVALPALELYIIENALTDTVNAKVGLIYNHDYYYGLTGGNDCTWGKADISTCKTSWMHLTNNDSGAPHSYNWTMSRLGLSTTLNNYRGFVIVDVGSVNGTGLDTSGSVQPVIYIKDSVQYLSGSGTLSDPILIN